MLNDGSQNQDYLIDKKHIMNGDFETEKHSTTVGNVSENRYSTPDTTDIVENGIHFDNNHFIDSKHKVSESKFAVIENCSADISRNFKDLCLSEPPPGDSSAAGINCGNSGMFPNLFLEKGSHSNPDHHNITSDNDEDKSHYQAILSSNCQDVLLTRDRPTTLSLPATGKRRLVKVTPEELSSPESPLTDDDLDKMLSTETDSQDDVENSIIQQLDNSSDVEKIPELTVQEERADSKNWKTCVIGGIQRKIDMRVIEPYKRVLSHGGYLTTGSYNAIITFSSCYLPHKSRKDYNYVMDNLFLYVISTLNQLITDDYVLVYLHGGTGNNCIPTFTWLKRCYQMIDRKLRKNLKALYLVHPTFWLKTAIVMIKPFVSSKFGRKMHFVNSLTELYNILPIEETSIPDRVKQYDRIKLSLSH